MAWLTHTRLSQIASAQMGEKAPAKGVAVPSPFDALAAMWARGVSRVAFGRERASVQQLLDVEDRLLSDMGITRDDVRHVLATQERPSLALQKIAEQRRRSMAV